MTREAAAGLGNVPKAEAKSESRRSGRRKPPGGGLGVSARFTIAMFCLTALPAAVCLLLVEGGIIESATLALAALAALYLGLLGPLGALTARYCVLDDLREVNAFCWDIKNGRYGKRFELGPEQDDEHDLLRLKRSLNWMAHHIETREAWLTARLRETDKRKRDFEELSHKDPLTGLFNRRFFDSILPEFLEEAEKGRGAAFMALIDCDRFKQVNDRFGHQRGDDALTTLGRVMRESVREGEDYPFRLGGDEFCVVFRRLEPEAAFQACERIRRGFAAANSYGCTVSIGLAGVAGPGARLEAAAGVQALSTACDKALYRAKGLGGNRTLWVGDEGGEAFFLPHN